MQLPCEELPPSVLHSAGDLLRERRNPLTRAKLGSINHERRSLQVFFLVCNCIYLRAKVNTSFHRILSVVLLNGLAIFARQQRPDHALIAAGAIVAGSG